MKINIFHTEQEANEFIKTANVRSIEYENGKIVVIHDTFPTVEEMRAKKIRDDEAEAVVGLQEAEMQLQYLQQIAKISKEEAKKVEGSIETAETNIKYFKAKLKAIELWKNE